MGKEIRLNKEGDKFMKGLKSPQPTNKSNMKNELQMKKLVLKMRVLENKMKGLSITSPEKKKLSLKYEVLRNKWRALASKS